MKDPLVHLRALLERAPSLAVFGQILEQLDECPGPELEAALAHAEAGLLRWPDELRWAGEQLLDLSDAACLRIKPFGRLVRKLEFEPSHAGCTPELVELIARAPELGNLKILNLLAEDVDCDGAAAIANSPTLAGLEQLRLGDKLGDVGLVAIARSPHLNALEQLELRGYVGEEETAIILANSPRMAKLVDLQLEDEGLEADAPWALGMSMYIPAQIRADYLDWLDAATLREMARASDIECPTEGSKSKLIQHLLGRTMVARMLDREARARSQ